MTPVDASFLSSLPLSKSRSILPIGPGLLHCWHHLMQFCLVFALICFWLNLIFQFTLEFSQIPTVLCNVNTEDSDHVISQMAVLISEIEGNCFCKIFSVVHVWRSSDLINVILQITSYVFHKQTPLVIFEQDSIYQSLHMFLLHNNLSSVISIHHRSRCTGC